MTESLLHFPIYIGDALKKFIENPTLEERGAWISIVVAMVHNDGELPDEESLYRHALIFSEQDKQSLSKTLAKLKKAGCIDDIKSLICKQKSLRKSRQEAGKKGGKKSRKNKQSLSNSESESESELESKSESSSNKKNKVTLAELSIDHIADWLSKKRVQGKYVNYDENHVLEVFKDYCLSKGKKYNDYRAALRNAFEWDRFTKQWGVTRIEENQPTKSKSQRAREAAIRGMFG